MKFNQKSYAFGALVAIGLLFLLQFIEYQRKINIQDMNYGKFLQALDAGAVESVIFQATGQGDVGEIRGEIKDSFVDQFKGKKFVIDGNIGSQGFALVKEKGLIPDYVRAENSFYASLLINSLPLIFLLVLFFIFFKQIQVGGGKAMSFGKSRARMLTENKNKVTFKDVAGVEEAKEDLQEVVQFLKDPKKFTKLGGKIPKGVLMMGPPGTGKTLLARAVAGEAGVPFFSISGSDFVEMFVGVGASRVRDLFEQGKKNAPCIIFIDEIDAVGRHRGAGMGGGHDEREQTLNQLLVEMDGFEGNEGVILIAATNRHDVLDPALLRPGRFDRRVVVSNPDLKGREQILIVHTQKTPLASNVEIKKIAQGTPGFSGADLANLVNEAALHAARFNKSVIEMFDFESAKDKILMGAERRTLMVSEEDRKNTAYHEAGHTLVAKHLKNLDPVHKVTIIPRGMALGVTQTLPEKEEVSLTKSKAENLLAFIFGGRAAEEIIFKDYTTGAGNDIEKATEIARRMVCEWGMSEKIGPIALEKREGQVFLGMQSRQNREYSESQLNLIDSEIQKLIHEGHEKAQKILNDHIDQLHMLAQALLQFETIDGEEVQAIVNGSTVVDLEVLRKNKEEKLRQEQSHAAAKALEEARAKEDQEKEDIKKNESLGQRGPLTV